MRAVSRRYTVTGTKDPFDVGGVGFNFADMTTEEQWVDDDFKRHSEYHNVRCFLLVPRCLFL